MNGPPKDHFHIQGTQVGPGRITNGPVRTIE